MSELTYRPGGPEDLEKIIELLVSAYGEYQKDLSTENWAVYIGGIRNRQKMIDLLQIAYCWVCLGKGEMIGVAFLIPSGNPTALFSADWSYIRMVGVHPGYRGQGIAKKLMEYCIGYARVGGEQTIALHTSEFMHAARHIYEEMGFRVLKEVPGLYGKQYWIYTLDLL